MIRRASDNHVKYSDNNIFIHKIPSQLSVVFVVEQYSLIASSYEVIQHDIIHNLVFYFVVSHPFYFLFRLTIQPHFSNATSSGDLIIDVVRDANEEGFPPIVLDINNITISETIGEFCAFAILVHSFRRSALE